MQQFLTALHTAVLHDATPGKATGIAERTHLTRIALLSQERNRQRRQRVVGTFVSPGPAPNPVSLSSPSKKHSGKQPRPNIYVSPRGIGPVIDPNDNDVLCGRGGRINAHPGNVQFRYLIQARKKDYLAKETRKLAKAHIAAQVVHHIRDMEPSGRFLKEDADGRWFDIGTSNREGKYTH
jgi:hypothetical protein